MSIRISRPSGALRFALRLPIHLYHLGLGWLLAPGGYPRFLLLTHCGRKSGRLYEAVLEVVLYHRSTRTCFVVSGWGDKTDWYRNIQAHPAVRVQVGRQSYAPVQHLLTVDQVLRTWAEFRRKHPIEERMALGLYSQPGVKYKNDDARREAILGNLRIVSFRPSE